jgi:hypothetical protein
MKNHYSRSNGFRFLTLLGLFTPLSSDAYNIDLLRNDKEASTHAYSQLEHRRAERKSGELKDLTFTLLAESINEIEKMGNVCEIELLRTFDGKLRATGLPNELNDLKNYRIVWRAHNLIDDLFFEIMEQTSEAYSSLLQYDVIEPSTYEINEMRELLIEKGISKFDLSMIYEVFQKHSIENPGCSINNWSRTANQIFQLTGNAFSIRLLNIAAKENGVLNWDEFKLVESFRSQTVENWNIQLRNYLNTLKDIKNKSLPANHRDSDFKPNQLSSKIKNRKQGITYRQDLYYRYNPTQIRMIEDLLKKTFDRMDATKAEVVFTYKDSSEAIPVSPMGQYFLARKLLRKDMDELNRSTFFSGKPITHEDLIATSLETGLINSEIVDSVLKIDDLWNPEVKKWKKISNYAFRVTGTATIFLPPPYNIVSSMALVFLDGMIDRKSRKPSQADQDYDVF